MTAMTLRRIVTVAVALQGCKQDSTKPIAAPFGFLQDSGVVRFRHDCPGTLDVSSQADGSGLVADCWWTDPHESFRKSATIYASSEHRIVRVYIVTEDRADVLRIFDRLVAPQLAERPREMLRGSILHPDDPFDLPHDGGRLEKYDDRRGQISWTFVLDVP